MKLDPLAGPQVMANAVQITSNNGDRPCNHPKLATIEGTDKSVLVYGSNDNQANVQTYAEVLNYDCSRATADRTRISQDANTNEGAPDVAFNGMRAGKYVLTAGYLSATNNGQSRATGLEVEITGTNTTLTTTYNRNIVSPANIGRPTIAKVSTDRSLFCSSKGNSRPPEDGVACALVNTTNGSVVWRELIAASEPNATPKIYFNQPQIAVGENNRYYVQMERSNGNGRNGNARTGRGSTTTFLYTLEPDEESAPTSATWSAAWPPPGPRHHLQRRLRGGRGDARRRLRRLYHRLGPRQHPDGAVRGERADREEHRRRPGGRRLQRGLGLPRQPLRPESQHPGP